MNRTTIATALCMSLAGTACVSKGTYDEEVQAANTARSRANECTSGAARLKRQLSALQAGSASMQKELDDATVVDDQLSKELAKLGEDSRSLLNANGSLKEALESSRRRLEELRRAQMASESRAALYRELALKLKGMVDAGDLAITLRDGRMVLRLSNDVLFDSGKAELKPAGKRSVAEIAGVLRTIPGRHFQVAGHTDNEPIRLSPFPSNWALSTARALEVVGFLTSRGMEARALSAAGYGEFDPVDANDSPLGKSHNRRTEITLQPNIDEIVAVPDGQ